MRFIFIFLLILFLYSLVIESNILTVRRVSVTDERLKGLRVVFASDFHVKPHEKIRLERTVKKINSINPDIILLGGDYVSGHKKGSTLKTDVIADVLGNLQSKYGTVAVMGNHDGWQGKKEVIEAFEGVGITVLENENKSFGEFCVAGIEDLQTGNPDIKKALSGVDKPVILLSHTPDIISDVPQQVNLTLSGHTHGGQVVFGKPFVVPSKFGDKYAYGYFEPLRLFVSRGLGTSILPLRFNCFPEVVLIEFI